MPVGFVLPADVRERAFGNKVIRVAGKMARKVIDPVVWSTVVELKRAGLREFDTVAGRGSTFALPFSCFSEPFASSCFRRGNHCWTLGHIIYK